MRKLFFIICLLFPSLVWAQQAAADKVGRVILHTYVPAYENLPEQAHKLLVTRLQQIVTSQGIADENYNSRFVLSAKINTIAKDIVPGPPQQVALKLEVTLLIGDAEERKLYAAATINANGVGTTEERAYTAAFRNIRPSNTQIQAFVDEGKSKISEYYQTHCQDILAEARKQAGTQNYGAALLALTSVPDVCHDCFMQCSSLAVQIYQQKTDTEGAALLQQAQAAWAQSPDRSGADEACSYLTQISYAAACQPQAERLMNDITAKLKADDLREWKLKVEQYRNEVAQQKREWAQEVKERDREQQRMDRQQRYDQARYMQDAATERTAIRAARDVGIAYALSQPQEITYYNCIYAW